MELLKSELSLILGESVSRVETLNCQPQSCLYALYDQSGQAMPMAVRYFSQPGLAEQEARKLMLLRQKGTVHVPTVYGVVLSERPPFHELLLVERLGGISAEVPAHSAQQWDSLEQQIIDGLSAWHSQSADGMSGYIDSSQNLSWPDWYFQYTSVLFSLLQQKRPSVISADDQQILHRTQVRHDELFADLSQPNVMIHGNLELKNIIKDSHTDRLLAMVQPGRMLWAPAEYELFRLWTEAAGQSLVLAYRQRYPLDEGFIWRSALYRLWYEVEQVVYNRPFSARLFAQAKTDLLPWLG